MSSHFLFTLQVIFVGIKIILGGKYTIIFPIGCIDVVTHFVALLLFSHCLFKKIVCKYIKD